MTRRRRTMMISPGITNAAGQPIRRPSRRRRGSMNRGANNLTFGQWYSRVFREQPDERQVEAAMRRVERRAARRAARRARKAAGR